MSSLFDFAAETPDVGERWRQRGWREHPPVIVAAPMDDGSRALTEAQLAAMAANYDPRRDVAAVVANLAGVWPEGSPGLSHGPAASQPPLGFVSRLQWEPPFLWATMWGLPDGEGEEDKISRAIEAGFVRRSIRLAWVKDPAVDGHLEHVCLLGGDPPAVAGMPLLEGFAAGRGEAQDYVLPGAEPEKESTTMIEEMQAAIAAAVQEALAPIVARIGALEAGAKEEPPEDADNADNAETATATEDRIAARVTQDLAKREADAALRADLTAQLHAAVTAGNILPAVAAPLRAALQAAGQLAPEVVNLAKAQLAAAAPVVPGPIKLDGDASARRRAAIERSSRRLDAAQIGGVA